ncbi:MAG: asparagine synthase (glutamine-hydrolyzing) [Desulfobulbus sp.]|nr:asparagine synthase (glutamine-hydrolyzing) [Desulfobulbus sp.]
MSGVAGYFNIQAAPKGSLRSLEQMVWSLRHRGPDGFGFFQDDLTGLGRAHLCTTEPEIGLQPLCNEDQTVWVAADGEIYNHTDLRSQLVQKGHRFAGDSDMEVLVHLYEEKDVNFLSELNGQYAIALYDTRKQVLLLARDRMGICPLFYCCHGGSCYFASEMKAVFAADRSVPCQINSQVLQDIFTFWSPVGADTIFTGVEQVQPGHFVEVSRQGISQQRPYWHLTYAEEPVDPVSEEELAEELQTLLTDAVRLRLQAHVPIGAYLSGGLDSSVVTALIRRCSAHPLSTFAVAFEDAVYDERQKQLRVSKHLQTEHEQIVCRYADIARCFPRVIFHTETPILRTAPAPLFLLSGLARKRGCPVILSGEGADEIFGGYDLFKEAKVRAFISVQPDSACRAMLLKRLYPYLALSPTRSASFAKQFFATTVHPESDLFYAHQPRWKNGRFLIGFLSDALTADDYSPLEKMRGFVASSMHGQDFFTRAQYVESRLLLPNYLLSSQGDRMTMAHSVAGRYPFLDHRVVEFAARVPGRLKMKGLQEKYLLKKAMRGLLPAATVQRKKQPYLAPDIPSFFGGAVPPYVEHLLSPGYLNTTGLFKPAMVTNLVGKCRAGSRQGFRENMALVGILSTQSLYEQFVENRLTDCPESLGKTKKIIQM